MMPDIDDTPLLPAGRARLFLFYAATVCAAVAGFFFIRSIGEELQAPAGSGQPLGLAAEQINTVFHALLALAVIVVTARAVGALFSYIGQPAVIGEVVGGILLGPSLLG